MCPKTVPGTQGGVYEEREKKRSGCEQYKKFHPKKRHGKKGVWPSVGLT